MHYKLLLVLLVMSIVSCKNDKQSKVEVSENKKELAYTSIGKQIIADDALAATSMSKHFNTMKVGDTIDSKMTAKIVEICSKKGCWMTLDIGEEKEVMVRFKDYGFFMPLDAKGEVIINGKAYVTETPVNELRHYAEDAGKSKEEIAAITEPEVTYGFLADGVLLKK